MAPTVRSFSAELDPLGLVAAFPDCYPGILESGATPAVANRAVFDILPIRSGETLRLGRDGMVTGPHAENCAGFLRALDQWWTQLRAEPQSADLPFSGGWFVYLGYEIAAEIEASLRLPAGNDPVVALAFRTPAAWIRDRASQRAWLVAESGFEFLLDRFQAHAAKLQAPAFRPLGSLVLEEEEPERFLTAVRKALDYIAAGDVYQANLSRRWRGESLERIDPAAVHARLRAANPAPFAALLRDGDFAVISSSPERLFQIRDNIISTRPIAGTRPRGASADEDRALIRALCDSEKERAEHIMLIDLERNDLGRVCSGGTVEVDEYMVVETYAHVHHIVSNVRGRLRAGVSPVQVIRALFPGGTITGCPKVRCMQIIGELEGAGRGAYTGSIGYINRDGSCDFNILIRTITAEAYALRFSAGAGIVADSIPAQELAETRAKAEGMVRALVPHP